MTCSDVIRTYRITALVAVASFDGADLMVEMDIIRNLLESHRGARVVVELLQPMDGFPSELLMKAESYSGSSS
jgi:hypothetical protein